MLKNFTTDRVISFEQLTSVDWGFYNIELRLEVDRYSDLPKVTLACAGIELLVRFDEDGNVSQFIPTHIVSRPPPYILNALWNELHATISTEHHGLPLYVLRQFEDAE